MGGFPAKLEIMGFRQSSEIVDFRLKTFPTKPPPFRTYRRNTTPNPKPPRHHSTSANPTSRNSPGNLSRFHVNVKAEPDPRFVFQFDGEPECSPQVFVLLRICKILRSSLRLGDGEREDLVSSIDFPIAVRWSKFVWQPYIRLQALPLDDCCSRQQMVVRSRTVLTCYEKAIYHRPDVASKQFGYKSVVVAYMMIDVKVRGRSGPKTRQGRDWREKYSEYVSVWNRRTPPGCLIIEEEVGVLENVVGRLQWRQHFLEEGMHAKLTSKVIMHYHTSQQGKLLE
ncbi:hypothetical protein RHSIM_Rhsim02G0019300 [Rhododendron simsii]|uniref:Uncharacterized protein n=1 Tax=Rhododendron simsii TaxID=118357 RepID=A0A834H9J7_RHOSS|nr:hypothetical protein RHSIM_Rhsim02G0019300 [Rhododendron simsii]